MENIGILCYAMNQIYDGCIEATFYQNNKIA